MSGNYIPRGVEQKPQPYGQGWSARYKFDAIAASAGGPAPPREGGGLSFYISRARSVAACPAPAVRPGENTRRQLLLVGLPVAQSNFRNRQLALKVLQRLIGANDDL